jgi:crossover junction endodeoxyribonuclease RuvC
MKILGIDPGTATVGFGVVEKRGDSWRSVAYGCILTSKEKELAQRLGEIAKDLSLIVEKYSPGVLAVEKLFFCKNVKTALDVGHARGVILEKGQENSLEIFEYTPLQIKQALTGYGRADKRQVQQMVARILKLKEIPKPDDAADALAVALCCGHILRKDD